MFQAQERGRDGSRATISSYLSFQALEPYMGFLVLHELNSWHQSEYCRPIGVSWARHGVRKLMFPYLKEAHWIQLRLFQRHCTVEWQPPQGWAVSYLLDSGLFLYQSEDKTQATHIKHYLLFQVHLLLTRSHTLMTMGESQLFVPSYITCLSMSSHWKIRMNTHRM